MCSCAVAMPSLPTSQQFLQRPLVGRRYMTDSDLKHIHDSPKDKLITSVASAPPSLGNTSHYQAPQSPSGSSSWGPRLHNRYDVAVRVMMKKHEIQFKLPPGELQTHLRAIFHHLRPQDNIKLAVRLESWASDHRRYLVIISTTGRQDTDESIIVGCDFETKESTTCTIGLVLPIWCDTNIRLDGDGGFHVECHEVIHTFKPVSVQAMWSALQSLHRCGDTALRNNYYEGSLFLTWMGYYVSKISSDRIYINEWEFRDNLASLKKEFFARHDPERRSVETQIRNKLKQVIMTMDLDNCTSRQVRCALENVVDMDLRDYKEYIDTEMMTVLGQMECPSKILDYLYLGSEWNACNLEELEELGITHILNVTIEIDNFFPDDFRYKNVRLHDVEESDLLPHWNHTWRFIAEAKNTGGKCLVHCRMGISRSSATVCAYLMKEKQWEKQRALEYVKACRSIICPNPAFQRQLHEYEGILFASAQRHNKLFRSRSESSLVEAVANEEQNASVTSPVKTLPPPHVNLPQDDVDGPMDTEEFDLNRHLLDIATLSVPKVSRPKSWSPDEGRACYKPNDFNRDLFVSEHNNASEVVHKPDFRHQNLSEPVELLAPASVDPERSAKVRELRKDFANKRAHLRRHTDAAVPVGADVFQLEDLAHSEDSVFVHDGSGSHVVRKMVREESKLPKKQLVARSSSPATLSCDLQPRAGTLAVQDTPLSTSFVSPIHSPSYQNAKNIDICLLKSKFSDSAPDSEAQATYGDAAVSQEACEPPDPSRQIKTSVPVKEIVAVIESPIEDASKLIKLASGVDLQAMSTPATFSKGHYKTASLPPANIEATPPAPCDSEQGGSDDGDPMTRSRSYSETQAFSVKKIVTQIEKRHTPAGEEKQPEGGEMHRSMSVPCGRRHAGSPLAPVCGFVAVTESPTEDDSLPDQPTPCSEKSGFYIGDAEAESSDLPETTSLCDANNNSNNNNNVASEVLTISEMCSPIADISPHKHSSPVEDTGTPSPTTHTNEPGEEGRVCHLSPEVLHIIREVGTQLMSDSDDSSFSSLTPRHSEESLKVRMAGQASLEQYTNQATPVKRRGIVRQMAREIEKSVRRLAGKASRLKQVKPKTPSASEDRLASPLNSVINKLLMGNRNLDEKPPHQNVSSPAPPDRLDEDVSAASPRLTDARVRELVDKFDCSSHLSPTSSPTKRYSADMSLRGFAPEAGFNTPRDSTKDIASLITPPPYRPPDSRKYSFSSFSLEKTPRVRRTQSERVGTRPQVAKRTGVFRSFRLADKRRPYLSEDSFTASANLRERDLPKDHQESPTASSPSPETPRLKFPQETSGSSPCPVRDMVRNIEQEFHSVSSVHRSSSMPSSSPSRVIPRFDDQPPMKALRKTKSTPLFGIIRSAYSTKKAVKKDKTKRNSK